MVSNNVNARIFDRAGSLYFVFYRGGYHGEETNTEFPAGLNRANHDTTLEIMTQVAREVPRSAGFSLLFDWLQGTRTTAGYWRVLQDDFTPGQASRSVSPRLSDTDMDIDS